MKSASILRQIARRPPARATLRRTQLLAVSIGALSATLSGFADAGRSEHFDVRHDASAESASALKTYRAAGGGRAGRSAELQATMSAARERLGARVPQLKVDVSPVMKTPEIVDAAAGGGALTAPSGNKPALIARGFVTENAGLFGLSAAQAAQLRTTADYANPSGNLSWVELQQVINGIPVFQGTLRAAIRKDGAIVRTTGNLAAGLDYAALPTKAKLTPAQAVAAAAGGIGVKIAAGDLAKPTLQNGGKTHVFPSGPFADPTKVELVYFPLEPGLATLAYSMVLWQPVDAHSVLVDAQTGRLLWRKNITNDQSQNVTYSVYNDDSPNPLSPTTATPGSGVQGAAISRSTLAFVSELPAFDNLGWITDGGNTTTGNNVDAGLDIDGADGVDAGSRPVGSPNRVFNFAYTPAGQAGEQAPNGAAFRNGVITNLFFWTNRYHDRLYQYGFTEPAGNYQTNNFGRGGSGNDAVSAQAQDSSGTNNANFSTPPDGTPGRMQMFIFDQPTPDRDGSLDQEIVIHELTHGLSNRLHANGSGLNSYQAAGMGEGWSDFYARSLLGSAGENLAGVYASGAYATLNFFGLGTDNYYYGIRRFPYALKTALGVNGKPHNPLTFGDIDPSQNFLADGAFAKSPVIGATATEVHNIGEVWCMALLEVRARIITRLGFVAGTDRTLQIVTDAMKLDPATPTVTQARDSIIAADNAGFAGADVADIFAGFAAMGLGFDSSAISSTQFPASIVESYFTPNLLLGAVTFSDATTGNNTGFADPGETILLSVPIRNLLTTTATGATAQVTGGGTGNYGSIASGQTLTQQINYTVPSGTPSGTRLSIPVAINSSFGAAGPVTPSFFLIVGQPVNGFTENFDALPSTALPTGWTSAITGSGTNWTAATSLPDSSPRDAFTPNVGNIGTATMTTPSIPITSPSALLTFRNSYNLESDAFNFYDGMVLEVSFGAGAFQDIVAAGCKFLSGGYNGDIAFFDNPLAGRAAWSGLSGGTTASPAYLTTSVLLPASANGQSVRFRWVVGCDSTAVAAGSAGARIDGVVVANGTTSTPVTNNAPVVTTTAGSLTYNSGQAATAIDPGLTVTDSDSASLVGGTVAITGNFSSGQDVLGFANQGGITGSYNSNTGVLTLSGTATVATYQTALRTVTYFNSSATPSTLLRTVTFAATDGALAGSNTRTINVVAAPGSPVITTTAGSLAYAATDPAVAVDSAVTAVDPDSANLAGGSVAITGNFAGAQDVLGFTNQGGISGSYNAGTGVLTLTGTATVAAYQTALRSVTYANSSATPSTALRAVTFTASDGALSGSNIRTINVTAPLSFFVLTLNVVPTGAGAIGANPAPNGQGTYAAGTVVTLTASANSGFTFGSFSGDATGTNNPVQVTMDADKTVNANFTADPIVPTAGTYFGLIESTTPFLGTSGFANANSGFLKLAVTVTSKFTGSIKYAGQTVRIRGSFGGQPTISGTIKVPHRGNIAITLSGGPDVIVGIVQDNGATSTIAADRNVFNKRTNPAPQAGKYTLLTVPTAPFLGQGSIPQGFGSGRVTVKTGGTSKVVGKLGDGSKFSVGSGISKFGTMPLYAAAYKKSGSVQGMAAFQAIANQSDSDGILNWFKPPRSSDALYPAGFSAQLNYLLSNFAAPARGQRILQVPDSTGNLRITLAGGNVAQIAPFAVTLDRNNRVVGNGGVGFKMSIKSKTGAFKGSFLDQATHKPRKFSGSMFQTQVIGNGFFKGAGQSGAVLLQSSSAPIVPAEDSPAEPTAD